MCGIIGIYSPNETVDKTLLEKMSSALSHRGPDQSGIFIDKGLGLAHRRLSIIDLSEKGKQPMHNEDGSIWITFNGEIYNYLLIKTELEKKGHRFYSNTDTEVVIHAYEEYGKNCVKKFNGMFAFAIWDSNKKQLFLARDRLGVKPLHYYYDGKRLIFASEIKAILADKTIPRKISQKAAQQLFALEYVPAPNTLFEGISKLPQSHTLLFDGKNIKIERYWDLEFNIHKENEKHFVSALLKNLEEATEKRLMSDVPFGAFLSGGIDSSAVVAMMSKVMTRPVKTFSIGFSFESYNELDDARRIAEHFRTDHVEKEFDAEQLFSTINEVLPRMDEPLGDPSILPTYLVAKLARQKVTMVLTGDGGDEMFAGYDSHAANKAAGYYYLLPGSTAIIPFILSKIKPTNKAAGVINIAKVFAEGARLKDIPGHFKWKVSHEGIKAEELFENPILNFNPLETVSRQEKKLSGINQAIYRDINCYLADYVLVKVDRATMMNSLEARSPFLDYELAEFAATIPPKLKLKWMTGKYILKKSLSGILPNDTLYKKKQGFSIPIKHFIRNELRTMVEETLSPQNIRKSGILKPEYVSKILNLHMNKQKDCHRHIWTLLSFIIWQKNYFE